MKRTLWSVEVVRWTAFHAEGGSPEETWNVVCRAADDPSADVTVAELSLADLRLLRDALTSALRRAGQEGGEP